MLSVASAALLLFFVMDPLGNVPLFLSALKHVPPARHRLVILRELVIALGVWIRNAIQILASGPSPGGLTVPLLVHAPLQAVTTALMAALVLVTFQRWLDIRLDP